MVMAAMGSNFASEDGHASEQLAAYYEARARGGVGLIIWKLQPLVGLQEHPCQT
jgi:2,4-dienoyl-CoA reductase-like NADH-dependent reductase (Old Yellow Enzyme family)